MRRLFTAVLFAIASATAPIFAVNAEDQPPMDAPVAVYLGQAPYSLAPRNALVIGIASIRDGQGFINLRNPSKDASAVSAALRSHGFSVTNLNDIYPPEQLTRQNIKLALYDFAVLLQSVGGVGVVYFSGHGVERNGQQYLVPYDAYVRFERDLTEELIPISLLYDTFAYAKNPLDIIFLDTCRDNPWIKPLGAFGTQGAPPLAPDADNVLLANSAMSGQRAHDGSGNLSPYAQAFVDAMSQPDNGIFQFFSTIGSSVHQAFPNEQTPTLQLKPHEFVFSPTKITFDREQYTYQVGVQRKSRKLLRQFAYEYPAGYFDRAARIYLETGALDADESVPISLGGPSASPSIVHLTSVRLGKTSDGLTMTAQKSSEDSRAMDSQLPVKPAQAVYVKSGQLQFAQPQITQQAIQLSFTAGNGTAIEALDQKSLAALRVLKDRPGALGAKIEILGFQYQSPEHGPSDGLFLLTRQATAIDALSAVGFDPSNLAVSSVQTGDNTRANQVELRVAMPAHTIEAPAPRASNKANKHRRKLHRR